MFELIRKIANGMKHYRSKAKTRTQKRFSSGFSGGFARPLMVKFLDGNEKSADRFLCEIIDFWRESNKRMEYSKKKQQDSGETGFLFLENI